MSFKFADIYIFKYTVGMNKVNAKFKKTEDGNIEITLVGEIPLVSRKSTSTYLSTEYKLALAELSGFYDNKFKGVVLFHFIVSYPLESNGGYDYDNINLSMIQDFATAVFLDPPDDSSRRLRVLFSSEVSDTESIKLVIVPEERIKNYLKEVEII